MIKLFSLKGYEYELYDAHPSNIRFVTFIPNQGYMASIDDTNEIRLWNLRDLTEEPRKTMLETEEGVVATGFYTP